MLATNGQFDRQLRWREQSRRTVVEGMVCKDMTALEVLLSLQDDLSYDMEV